MTTIVIWLLVSIGNGRVPTVTVDRFATPQACQAVADEIREDQTLNRADLRCIQATVVRP